MSAADEVTRDLRRTVFLTEAIHHALSDLERAQGRKLEGAERTAVLGMLHRHMSLAWDDGALREADLRAAVSTLSTKLTRLEAESRSLRARLGDAE
jgi:hypothetical protein